MGKISSFITGAAVGVAAALLLAPRTGEEMRAFVTEKANAFAGEAKDFGAGMPGSAQEAIKSVFGKGSSTGDASSKGQNFSKSAAGKASAPADSDELREKIEAARKRIAAQVMENAEQNQTVATEAEAPAAKEPAAAEEAKAE